MKKILGVLFIALVATTMFFVDNSKKSTNEKDLASLLSIVSANAEDVPGCRKSDVAGDYCKQTNVNVAKCINSTLSGCTN